MADCAFALFSQNGFAPDLSRQAADAACHLLTLEDLYAPGGEAADR